MKKQPSVISVAKIGNGYSVDARGAFGGGYTGHSSAEDLPSAITRAWQMYGRNPLGCSIIGQLTPEAKKVADELMSAGEKDTEVITLRLPANEAEAIREAAAMAPGGQQSINKWCRAALAAAVKK